eukprot:gb/GEZN01011231.1/.p1 GENE.gb/GEZN01011231.1/~~gb/GEZN01011231.1/.p1  ORF type:complete len:331 (+),score=32.65 gb/GEZN01011231.1/:175-1167(+)
MHLLVALYYYSLNSSIPASHDDALGNGHRVQGFRMAGDMMMLASGITYIFYCGFENWHIGPKAKTFRLIEEVSTLACCESDPVTADFMTAFFSMWKGLPGSYPECRQNSMNTAQSRMWKFFLFDALFWAGLGCQFAGSKRGTQHWLHLLQVDSASCSGYYVLILPVVVGLGIFLWLLAVFLLNMDQNFYDTTCHWIKKNNPMYKHFSSLSTDDDDSAADTDQASSRHALGMPSTLTSDPSTGAVIQLVGVLHCIDMYLFIMEQLIKAKEENKESAATIIGNIQGHAAAGKNLAASDSTIFEPGVQNGNSNTIANKLNSIIELATRMRVGL